MPQPPEGATIDFYAAVGLSACPDWWECLNHPKGQRSISIDWNGEGDDNIGV